MASPPPALPALPCDADCYTEQYILQIGIPVGIIAFLAICCLCYGCCSTSTDGSCYDDCCSDAWTVFCLTQRSKRFQSQSAANNNRSGSGSLVPRRVVHLRSRWISIMNSYSLHVAATSRSLHSTALALRHGCSASSRAPKHSA